MKRFSHSPCDDGQLSVFVDSSTPFWTKAVATPEPARPLLASALPVTRAFVLGMSEIETGGWIAMR